MPPLHRDSSELGVVPCGKEIWTRPQGTTRGPNMKLKEIELKMWGEACEFTKEPISQNE